jgi:acyl-CoA synthetase (AMP-forming)/AMP-acid ligase II
MAGFDISDWPGLTCMLELQGCGDDPMRAAAMTARPTLTNLIRSRAHLTPAALAMVTPDREWTFVQIQSESNRMAQGLLNIGVMPGDRIGCYTRSSVECVIALLAAAKIGAACGIFNWRLAAPELEYVVNQSEAKFLVSDLDLKPMLERIKAPLIKTCKFADALEAGDSLLQWRAAQVDHDTGFEPAPGDTVLQLNSSGTTGLPKSVALSHYALMTQCEKIGLCFGYTQSPRFVFLNALPNFHVAGIVNLLSTMYEGGVSICYPEFIPAKIVPAFQQHQITHAFFVPAMIQFLLEVPGVDQADFSSLKGINYGGSPISESLLVRAMKVFGCDFYQVYGMTEIAGSFSILSPKDHDPEGPRAHLLRSAGKPVGGFEVRIVDPISGAGSPDGQTGEIWARSDTIMNGYYRNPEASAAVFPQGRGDGATWYRTGDAGCLENGYIFIKDRVKDMIISGGENIYPAEIENVLASHPDVVEVAIIGVPDERWGEAVKACVVLRPGRDVSAMAILTFCRERLAGYKCPKTVDFLEILPRNPSGKLLKRILREPYWAGRERNVA